MELTPPTAIPAKEAKSEMETHPVAVEAKLLYKPFCDFYFLHFALLLQLSNSLFHLLLSS